MEAGEELGRGMWDVLGESEVGGVGGATLWGDSETPSPTATKGARTEYMYVHSTEYRVRSTLTEQLRVESDLCWPLARQPVTCKGDKRTQHRLDKDTRPY